MGTLKFALIVLLVSASINGQEDPIVNEDEQIVSDNAADNAVDAVEPPVEVLTENEPLLVRSGKYQNLDEPLAGAEQGDTETLNVGADDGMLNQRQYMPAYTTSAPNDVYNEYGKHDILYSAPRDAT